MQLFQTYEKMIHQVAARISDFASYQITYYVAITDTRSHTMPLFLGPWLFASIGCRS